MIEALTKRTQDGGTEVVNAKAGKVRSMHNSGRMDFCLAGVSWHTLFCCCWSPGSKIATACPANMPTLTPTFVMCVPAACVCVCRLPVQGSATLSMAYAAALFGDAVLRGLNGATATECAYVESDVTDVPYFATKVKLGTEGELGGLLNKAPGSGR